VLVEEKCEGAFRDGGNKHWDEENQSNKEVDQWKAEVIDQTGVQRENNMCFCA
jgi:hypothetical protein